MTELEKEAKEYVSTTASGTAEEMEMYEHFYLAAAEPREKRIEELEKEKRGLQDYCNNYVKTILSLRNTNNDLEAQIKKMKQDLDNAREDANKQEQWDTYSILNDIYNDNFEAITSVSN